MSYELGILFLTKKKILYKAQVAARITGANVKIIFILLFYTWLIFIYSIIAYWGYINFIIDILNRFWQLSSLLTIIKLCLGWKIPEADVA